MELQGRKFSHKKYGAGQIIKVESNGAIHVKMNSGESKIFCYPESFVLGILSFVDEELNKQAVMDFEKQQMEKKEKQEENQNKLRENINVTIVNKKKVVRRNIAFKCNFCDGGADAACLGFCGICSAENMRYNIEDRKNIACRNSICNDYLAGNIPLEPKGNAKDFVCYESTMLRDWRASAGWSMETQKPERIVNAQKNSLCVLTTCEPNSTERIIFGAFIVDNVFEGDEEHEGYVEALQDSKYKIKLTPKEAMEMKFWDFYQNRNNPESKQWGQGLFRYLDKETNPKKSNNDIAINILKAIIEVKKGKPDEKLANDILKRFCEVNGLNL